MTDYWTWFTVELDDSHTYQTNDPEQAEKLSRDGHRVTAVTTSHPSES